MMLCPKCNSDIFYAHQIVRLDIIVDKHGDWFKNIHEDVTQDIHDSGTPYGPFTCTNCGHQFDELK